MKRIFHILSVTLLLAAVTGFAADKPDPIVIIVGAKSSLHDISKSDLVRVFRGEKQSDGDGNKIVVLMRERRSPERAVVLKEIYQMSEEEYETYFLQATFTGAVHAAPKKLSGADATRQFVADNPGAIGYIRLSEVDDSVQVVKIDGKSPNDPDYLLKQR